jgi:hypothetical protein
MLRASSCRIKCFAVEKKKGGAGFASSFVLTDQLLAYGFGVKLDRC